MKKDTKNNFTKQTHKTGVSLIVLIITIIVIIILVAAVILTLSKNNPVESAREARFKEDIRTMQDELSMYLSSEYTKKIDYFDPSTVKLAGNNMTDALPSTKGYDDIIEVQSGKLGYKGKNKKEKIYFKEVLGDSGLVIVSIPEEWETTIVSMTEDEVPISKGFTYVEGAKETGVVIKDGIGNEFVWVPATEDTYGKDLEFPSKYIPTGEDTLPNGVTDEVYDVKKYGGFYIGRYEAGIPLGDTAPINKTGIPISKKGAIVWTNIDYYNAKASVESMISNEYVQTGLLTGKSWDTTCHWIEDEIIQINEESSLTNSTYYGNYYNSKFKYINSSNEEVEKAVNSNVKIPTGSAEYTKTKNIYDLAGNVWEWTN